ncbi:auxin-induced protein 22D-like [Canna indica]|uniref:Auxin-responsive protein n=1 Tax=Canna indica TaxID=4628 RepID=A0AAQ3Q1Y1_9LILI|nr:auxin-induced protein 22D-like [Canna indica]
MEDLHNLRATELTLGLPGTTEKPTPAIARVNKRTIEDRCDRSEEETDAPAAKAPLVGWPPVRSYRMNSFRARKIEEEDKVSGTIYVKVSMDGAPYLRKVNLNVFKGYKELMEALNIMFKCFSIGGVEGRDESGYAMTYEDKDGDWMLVGDVPWEMFISSCKRLRIMKGSEARGLSSRQ